MWNQYFLLVQNEKYKKIDTRDTTQSGTDQTKYCIWKR